MNKIEQEKLARTLLGAEADGKHFILNGENADNVLKEEAVDKFNDSVDSYVEEFENRNKRITDYANEVIENSDDLEIMPIGINLIVSPFSENPFQRIKKSESGLILNSFGGEEYKSHEDGEMHREESFIKVATVICVGPECKYIKEGDTVMYTKPSSIPVPFFKQGLECLPESRVTAVIASGLQQRFNK